MLMIVDMPYNITTNTDHGQRCCGISLVSNTGGVGPSTIKHFTCHPNLN